MFRKGLHIFLILSFFVNLILPVQAQEMIPLPSPGTMMGVSQSMNPVTLRGLKVDPNLPFRFQFLVSKGDAGLAKPPEVDQIVRYFFNALTTPEKEIWVNLSPLEHDRIVAPEFGRTSMGRDLLSLDYILKQLTSSLMYPDGETGKIFWNKIYAKAHDLFGTTDIPTDVFNKVWVVSSKAKVYENGGVVYITEDLLDVMLDSDHALMQANGQTADNNPATEMTRQVIRENILPIIKKEVNEGAQFATLRQVHRALILATWYKKRLKDSLLARAYADQNKIQGVTYGDPAAIESIYNNYVQAFKRGVYNYVREDKDSYSGEVIPRKYFAGGMNIAVKLESDSVENVKIPDTGLIVETVDAMPIGPGLSGLAGSKAFYDRAQSAFIAHIKTKLFVAAVSMFLAFSSTESVAQDVHAREFGEKARQAMQALENPNTKLVPSHIGMPGLENIAFSYDLAVEAGAFKAAGQEEYAKVIMDFFMDGLSNSSLTKNFKGQRAFMNGVNVRTGAAGLEFSVTPGPNAWVGLSALTVDAKKYLPLAVSMGEVLLTMQGADGGIVDGDRNPNVVNTEPHMDAVALFYRLFVITKDKKWKTAADKGKDFFYKQLYIPSRGVILQSSNSPEGNFATDAYSWTLLGAIGNEIPPAELKVLIDNMLKKSLVRVEAPIPGGEVKTLTLVDFTDARSRFATAQRGGVHPLGSVEWTGGVIMALQTAAVRLSASGDVETAKLYKAIAEELLQNVQNAFGRLRDGNLMAFYATESGIQTGHGWKTPFPAGPYKGSPIGFWIMFTQSNINPFTGESYGDAYGKIAADGQKKLATDFINTAVEGKVYSVKEGKIKEAAPATTTKTGNNSNVGKVEDLLAERSSGQISGSNWKSTFLDLDIEKGIPVVPGQKVKITIAVTGANSVAIALLVGGEMPGDRPENMKKVAVKDGQASVEFVIPQGVTSLKQVFVAHGDLAWGERVGSQSSRVTFKKVELVKDNAQSVGGIDLSKIDLHLDATSGAASFEINDSVVSAFQERLFGVEPVFISSVPLVDLQGFLMAR